MSDKGDTMPPSGNGWEEWGKHILAELKRHNECVDKIDSKVDSLEDKFDDRLESVRNELRLLSLEVTTNKVKIMIYGAIGGLVASGIMSIIVMLIQRAIP